MAAVLYLCVHVGDFAAQALTRDAAWRGRGVVVLSGAAPLERVFAMNAQARGLGVREGMSRLQAESFGVAVRRRERAAEEEFFSALMARMQRFSPRVQALAAPADESCGATLVLDLCGSERLLGPAEQVARAVHDTLAAAGYEASVATSEFAATALLAARGRRGVTVVPAGGEAALLAELPVAVLEPDEVQQQTFAAWGVETLGQLATLPSKSLAARMGQAGLHLQAQARGRSPHLLVPAEAPADAALTETMELEHPVELLEPLLFLLGQMLERLLARAGQRALSLAAVESCLLLEVGDGTAEEQARMAREHRRVVRPALPERDRMTLLKLVQLDLEMHPPGAAVRGLRLTGYPARPQTAQHGLFAAQAPEAGRLEVLLARLRKLVGEGRVGSPELLDTHAPEGFRVAEFAVEQAARREAEVALPESPLALRMIRPPRAVRVELLGEAPEAMHYEGQRLRVRSGAGPWRASGAWWTHPAWTREEWDVVLQEPAARCLRLAHDPAANCWYVIGIYD